MTQHHVLHVSTDGEAVGQVFFDQREDRYTLEYDRDWAARGTAFYLSPAIPLDDVPATANSVQRFLENLLPEGRALDIAAVMNQVSKSNTFGLIHALGKEPVGALSFLALDADVEEAARIARQVQCEPVRRHLSSEELSSRIRERGVFPFPVWDGVVRLSLAGFQDKLQVLVEGPDISFADGSLSSTHLLKPDSLNPNTPCIVANEHFCMTLAARIGLPVAPVEIRRLPEPILLIERFDRRVEWDAAHPKRVLAVNRMHVIDGCQALDFPSTLKYERNLGKGEHVRNIREGVSYERLFSLLERTRIPTTARLFLLRWALLQVLLGNSDAHGKNISFHVHRSGLSPAPIYDLVCVSVYGPKIETDLAMAYGDAFTLEDITPYALADFAMRTNTPRTQLAREIVTMANAMLKFAPGLAKSEVYLGDEREHVRRIADFVCMQANRFLKLAPEVPKIDAALL